MHRITSGAIFLAFFSALILEGALFRKYMGSRSDLMIVILIFIGLFYGVSAGLRAGFICGFIKDIFGVGLFGSGIISLIALGVVMGWLSDKVYRENFIVQTVLVFISTLLVTGGHITYAITNSLLAPVVFIILHFVFSPSTQSEEYF